MPVDKVQTVNKIKSTHKVKTTKPAALLGAVAMCAMVTYAAEDQKTLEEVLVEAHRAYLGDFVNLEIPQAKLEIDESVFRDAGALDLTQVLDLSASVARQNNFGGLWNSFSVRGFVGDEDLPSNYLVNGFNAGRGFGGPRDLSGVASVEVLKGPRAALFGRGEPGGTINLVTKRPTFENSGELRLMVGSYNTYRTDLDWTSPLSDTVAIRLVGFYEDAESFRDTIETTKHGFNPSIAFRLNEQSQLTYELEYSNQEIPFDRGVIAIDDELGQIPESRFLGEPGEGPIETDVLGHQIEFQHEFSDDWSALVGFNYRDTSLEGYATENGFGDVDDAGNFGRFRRYRDYDAIYQVFRAEISGDFSTGELTHRIIVGLDVDAFENDQFALRDRSGDQNINVFNPVYGRYALPELDPITHANLDQVETQESFGVYIQDQISLTDNIDIRIGARLDDYTQELNNRRTERSFDQTDSRVSPQFGVVYKASELLSIYAAYGENFRLLTGADADDNLLTPNDSNSVEAGVKFDVNDGALTGTVAVFHVEQGNLSTFDENFFKIAIGEAQSQGLEVDLNGQVTERVTILASYAYIDAEMTNEFDHPGGFGTQALPGTPLLNIPEHQLSLQVTNQARFHGQALNIGGGLLYVGERNGFFANAFELPSYVTVRAFAKYELTGAVGLRLEINNLFDEEYYSNSYSDTWVQPGTPRNYRLSATFGF